MLNIRYNGLRIVPTLSAAREMAENEIELFDIKSILELGYIAPRKRKRGTIERWLDSGNKTYNVVAVRSYNYLYREEIYLVTHIGMFTKKRFRRKK